MITEWAGEKLFRIRGQGWKPLSEIEPGEATALLAEIDQLMRRLAQDVELIRALAKEKQAEAGR